VAVFMLIVATIGLIICIREIVRRKPSIINVTIAGYFIAVVLQGMTPVLYAYLGYPTYFTRINIASEYFFGIIEFVAFGMLFVNILTSARSKLFIKLTLVLFPLISIVLFATITGISARAYEVSLIAAFLMIGVCLIYFYELFLFPPVKKLTEEPAFWIATGILLYLVCLIPNLLVLQFVAANEYFTYEALAYISFIASSILYVFFIKALLCKTYLGTL